MKGLIFVYAAALLGVVGALYRPYIALYVYVLFAILRPRFLWGWADNFDNLSYAVGMAMLIGWALRGFGSRRLGRGKAAALALLGFSLWSALSALQALNTSIAFDALINLSKIVLPFLVGMTTLRGELHARALCWVIVVAQSYICLQLNLTYLDGYNQVQEQGFGGMDNNCFGIALVATIGPAMALAVSSKSWLLKALAGVCTLLVLHTTLLTFSRGAMLALVVVFIVAIIIAPKRPLYLIAIAVFALVAVRLTGPEVLGRFGTTFNEEESLDASAKGRLKLWQDCLLVANDYPLLGIGPDNWPKVAAQYGWPEGKQAHSVWFQLAAEIGYLGMLMLLAFYLFTVWKLWPIARRRDPAQLSSTLLASGVILSIIGFVISAQFVTLQGLEIPYYVTMAGLVLLNGIPRSKAAPVRVTVESPLTLPTINLPARLPAR